MFIIKYYSEKKGIFYKYSRTLFGAKTDVYPYIGDYYIGYKNSHGHEILDIIYLYNGKFYTLEEYRRRLHYSNNKTSRFKDKIAKIIDVIKE